MIFKKSSATALGILLGFAGVVAYVAYRTRRVLTPKRRWRRFNRRDAVALTPDSCEALQGIYHIEEGKDFFGESAVVKCSYTVERGRKIYHLSFFCEKGGLYLFAKARNNKVIFCYTATGEKRRLTARDW